jgi:hypothetical protein
MGPMIEMGKILNDLPALDTKPGNEKTEAAIKHAR